MSRPACKNASPTILESMSLTRPTSAEQASLPDPLGLTSGEFLARVPGLGPEQAMALYRSVYREGRTGVVSVGGQPRATVSVGNIGRVLEEETPEGRTVKFLTRVQGLTNDANKVSFGLDTLWAESVIIPMIGRLGKRTHTLCVSSQVGCAMGCTFCETAQMGRVRNLSAAEIVAQWFTATHLIGHLEGGRINNLVFMGMGEPLDNFDAVAQAIRVLCDHNGPALGASNITVSTVGRIDGLAQLAGLTREEGFRRLGLAVSINAPNDEIRSQLMPINRAMPMSDLREALLRFPMRASGKICFEYVLIPGVNDADEHAAQLAHYLAPFGKAPGRSVPVGLVNLIPYNPRRNSPWPAPEESDVERFMSALVRYGVYVKRRRTKGRDMMGACGQLGSAEIRRRRLVNLTIDGSGSTRVTSAEPMLHERRRSGLEHPC